MSTPTYTDSLGIVYSLTPGNSNQGTASVIGFTEKILPDLAIPMVFHTEEGYTYYVISIGNNAFKECKSLKSVVIPYNMTSVNNGMFSIGDAAFKDCSNLGLVQFIIYDLPTFGQDVFSGLPECEARYDFKAPFVDTKDIETELKAFGFKPVTNEEPYYSLYPPTISTVSIVSTTSENTNIVFTGINLEFIQSISFGNTEKLDDSATFVNNLTPRQESADQLSGYCLSTVLESLQYMYIVDLANKSYTVSNPLYNVIPLTSNISVNFTNDNIITKFTRKHFNIIANLNLKKLSGSIKLNLNK